jgi:hypothetical protein
MKNLGDFIWSSTYKSDYFRDEKNFGISKPWSTPRFKMARDKVHLNYGKSQTEISQLRVGTPWFYYGNNFTCF